MLDGMFDWFDPGTLDHLGGLDLSGLEMMELPEFAEFADNPFADLFLDPKMLEPLAKLAMPSGPGAGSPGSGMSANPFDPTMLGQLMKMLGGGQGLASLAGLVGGGINANNATKEAQERMERAVSEANDTVRGLLGGAQEAYKPYTDAGAQAVAKLSAMGPSNLAAQFGPVAGGGALAGRFGQISQGPIGQASNMASRFKPLGSGRALSALGGR